MRNVKLVLAYDGTDFSGWQTQPGRRTVQETLEQAIRQLTGEDVRTMASGRTDAGVHALGQVVNFHTQSTLPAETVARALNATLPDDIVVHGASEVADSFNANFDVKRKLYRYVMHNGPVADVFLRRFAHRLRVRLDAAAMHRAAQRLAGRHDFQSFETDWPNRSSSVRTITHISVNRGSAWPAQVSPCSGDLGDLLWLDVEADGFLYNMVRAIAGTLINVGRGFWPEERVRAILEARDRRQAGPTAPAKGLFLVRVEY